MSAFEEIRDRKRESKKSVSVCVCERKTNRQTDNDKYREAKVGSEEETEEAYLRRGGGFERPLPFRRLLDFHDFR